MTTIDHQQAAVEAGARVVNPDAWEAYDRSNKTEWEHGMVRRSLEKSENIIQAAEPHLRAAWEQPIRGICEQAIQDKEDSLCRMFNGEPFPAMIPATAVLALLEGGGACCEHPKCPGGSICCCQEGGGK